MAVAADVASIRKVLTLAGENPDKRPLSGMPYTLLELHVSFAKVQNKTNWKLPIYATIEDYELSLTLAAVIFFTGGGLAKIERRPDGKIDVVGHGYYFHTGA